MPQKIIDKLAYLISGLSSPYFLAIIFPLFIIHAIATPVTFLKLGVVFVTFIALFPLIFVWLGVKAGRYTDIHVAVKDQRGEPFIFATICAAALIFIFIWLKVPLPLIALSVAVFCNGVLYLIITRYWKISMHAASLAGSITSLAILVNLKYFWLLLLLPLVFWARLHRQRHDQYQALVGATLVSLVTYLILKVI